MKFLSASFPCVRDLICGGRAAARPYRGWVACLVGRRCDAAVGIRGGVRRAFFAVLTILLCTSCLAGAVLMEGGKPIVPKDPNPLPTEAELAKAKADRKLWEGNRIGLIKDVPPPPWTPMSTKGERVECYGRVYDFRKSLFVSQVESLGKELLARPVGLVLVRGDEKQVYTSGKVAVREQDKLHALLSAETTQNGLRINTEHFVDFDGMVKITLRLRPEKGPVKLDRLYFEIPVKKAHAPLYMWKGPSMDPSVSNAGKLPPNGLMGPLHRVVWLGDYERGMCWFAPSDKNWRNSFPAAQIQVVNGPEENVIRLNLIDNAFTLAEPVEYVFGIQATPVKPYPTALREWSFGLNTHWSRGFLYMEEQPLEEGYSPKWFTLTPEKCQPYAYADSGPKNMQLLWSATGVYAKCFRSGKVNPEYSVYHNEWRVDPDEPLETNFPQQEWCGAGYYVYVCEASSFADYYIWKMDRLISKFKLRGIYTDGTSGECRNGAHGCGYVGRDGKRKPEWNVFAAREAMKRLYVLLRRQNPEQTYWVNSANMMLPPIYAFTDMYLDGEYCNAGRTKVTDHYSQVLPPDRIAAEYMGSQWGVAQYLLPMLAGDYARLPGPNRELWALIMPHDIQAMGAGYVTGLLRQFGAGNARFVGYWRPNRAIQGSADNDRILTSYYVHNADKKALAIVSNLTDKPIETTLKIDGQKLFGGDGKLGVFDFETKREVGVGSGKLAVQLDVKRYDFRVFEIKPSG